jgi:hypothetical protein
MKLSIWTALALAWLSGTIASLLLPRGPLVLCLYGLLLLIMSGTAHLVQPVLAHQFALAAFRRDLRAARRRALRVMYGGH